MNLKLAKKGLIAASIAVTIVTTTGHTAYASGGPTVTAEEETTNEWRNHKIAGGYVTILDQRLPQGENIYATAWPVNENGFYDFPSYLHPIDIGTGNYPITEQRVVMVYDDVYGKEGFVSATVVPGYGVTLPETLHWVSDSLKERGIKQPVEGLPDSSLMIYPCQPVSVVDQRTNEWYNIEYPIDPSTGMIYELPSYLSLMPYQPNFEKKEPTFAKVEDTKNHRYGLGRIYLDEMGEELIDLPETLIATTRFETTKSFTK